MEELISSDEEIKRDCDKIHKIYMENLEKSYKMNAEHRKKMAEIRKS